MNFSRESGDFSREQLYDVIHGLKVENNCLKTDLIKYKFLTNNYQKIFEFVIQFNETIASKEEVLDLIKDIKTFNRLTEEKCFVSLKRLSNEYLNKTRVRSVEQNCSESQQTIESKPTESDDTSEEIPERKPIKIEIKIEDIKEEDKSFITDLLIERKPNIEEIKDISINLKNKEINVNSETNVYDIEYNSRTGHQLNETLNPTIVKTETQTEDNSEEISNESQNSIEAIEECKQKEDIESIDITENDSDLDQAIDERNEFRNLAETQRTTPERMITQTTEDIFVCDICSANLKTKYSLKIHKNRHTNRYLCKVGGCGYRGSKLYDLKRHVKTVHRITDPIIDRTEDNNSSLEQMSGNRFITQIQNNSKIGFKCEVCSVILKTHKILVEHKIKHTNEFACAWGGCQFRGSSAYDLRRHRMRAHSKTKAFNYYFKDSNKRIEVKNKSNECLIPQKLQINDKTQGNNELNDISIQSNDQSLKKGNQLMTGRHSPSKLFKCDVKGCEKLCQTSRGLLYHKNTHSDIYLCGINGCQQRAGSQSHLDRHKQRRHSNEKPYKCVVNGCDKRLKTRIDLRAHEINLPQKYEESSDDSDFKRFDCLLKYCEKKFSSRMNLRKHMIRNHKLTPNLVNIYFEKYDKNSAVKETQILDKNTHKKTNHLGDQRSNDSEETFIERQFEVNKTIENNSHKRIRSEEEIVEDSDEERAEKLMDHKNNEMNKNKGKYVCDHNGCGKRLKSALTLRAHKERHTGVVYKCFWSNCSAVFNNNQRFRSHLIRHKGIYRCDWSGCQFRGTCPSVLRTHKNRHLENRLFLCSICNKRFYKKDLLKEHQMAVHQIFNECNDGLENK